MNMPLIIGLGIAALVVILLLALGYLKAPPDTAYIISGPGRRRILIGRAGWRIPFLERVDKLSLNVMQVDVKTSEAVPTNEFINVLVDGVANIKVSSDPELLKRAAESLLGMKQQQLIAMVTQVLEGNMREIVGSVGLKEMVQDRQGVAKKITENVVPDMRKLGIEVGGVKPDGRFSLEATRCIGACGLAPVFTIGDDVYGKLTPEEAEAVLAKYE